MISEFQDKYPNTEIIYETGEGSEGTVTVADRIRALNARILAGDGPDILVLDGLPTESYIEKSSVGRFKGRIIAFCSVCLYGRRKHVYVAYPYFVCNVSYIWTGRIRIFFFGSPSGVFRERGRSSTTTL